jgi:hypothetical protein
MAASGIKPDTQVYYASVYMVQAKKPAVKFIWLAKRTAGGRALPDYWPRDCLGSGGGGGGGGEDRTYDLVCPRLFHQWSLWSPVEHVI